MGKEIQRMGKEVLRKYLQECLESKEVYQRNTWNTALLRALVDDVEVLKTE